MSAKRAGGGDATHTPTALVEQPRSPSKDHRGVAYCITRSARAPVSRTSQRSDPLRTTLVVGLGLTLVSAGILGGPWLAGHLPDVVFGFCIVLLGVLIGAMLAVKS